MMHRWLHLRLTAPLLSFGGVAIDHIGPTRDFPSTSALTGLLANAIGLRREDWQSHQSLQSRLIFGAVNVRQGRPLTDNQNAKLEANDRGWTTWGNPDERAGASYDSPHRRRRDYLADHDCHVVLRLADDTAPDLDRLAAALNRPLRPLFLGRKPCLPSGPLLQGLLVADTVRAALMATGQSGAALWPADEGSGMTAELADLRDWRNGFHAGSRRVSLGCIA